MLARTPTLAGEAYPECGLGSVSISPVFRHKAPVFGCSLDKDNSDDTTGRTPDSLPYPALG